jgi:hypothetical protein
MSMTRKRSYPDTPNGHAREVRVAAWHRGERATTSRWPLHTWEPGWQCELAPVDSNPASRKPGEWAVCGATGLTYLF